MWAGKCCCSKLLYSVVWTSSLFFSLCRTHRRQQPLTSAAVNWLVMACRLHSMRRIAALARPHAAASAVSIALFSRQPARFPCLRLYSSCNAAIPTTSTRYPAGLTYSLSSCAETVSQRRLDHHRPRPKLRHRSQMVQRIPYRPRCHNPPSSPAKGPPRLHYPPNHRVTLPLVHIQLLQRLPPRRLNPAEL